MQRLLAQKLTAGLGDNQFLVGAAVLGILSSLVALLYTTARFLLQELKKAFIVSVEVTKGDEAYQWLMLWTSSGQYTKTARHLTAFARRPGSFDHSHRGQNTRQEYEVFFLPAMGYHAMRYEGRLIWMYRGKQRNNGNAQAINMMGQQLATNEIIKVYTYGRDNSILKRLVYEARRCAQELDAKKTIVYTAKTGSRSYWSRMAVKSKRPFTSVILKDGRGKAVLDEIREFNDLKDWYQERGLNHRRGYLLYGPPGNGKTSFVQALAGELGYNICMLSLSDPNLDDSNLVTLLQTPPKRSLVLLEDIDAAFNNSTPEAKAPPQPKPKSLSAMMDRRGGMKSHGITFSGLLNAIDGVQARDGRILFMTTNRKHVLDPALIRAGRADKHIYFGNATKKQAKKLFLHFYYSSIDTEDVKAQTRASAFAEKLPGEVSMAAVQEYLLQHRKDPVAAVQNVHNLLKSRDEEAEATEKSETAQVKSEKVDAKLEKSDEAAAAEEKPSSKAEVIEESKQSD